MKKINSISDLKPAKRNARDHGQRNLDMIEASLKEYGAARSIVIDEKGEIIAGHGTVTAAAKAGITKVRTVETDGQEIVAVVRSGMTEEQKQEMAIADNRTGELADWNSDILNALKGENAKLAKFFDDSELSAIIGFDSLQYEEVKTVKPPPKMQWILIGHEVSDAGEVAAQVAILEKKARIIVKTTRDE